MSSSRSGTKMILAIVWTAVLVALAAAQGVQQRPATQSEPLISFNIPPQPLAKALHSFSAISGIEVLVDARSSAGVQSPGVTGSIAPHDALERLLAGSKLVPENFGPLTVTLNALSVSRTGAASIASDPHYFADIQRAVQHSLCSDARTAPGQYRLALKLWIGQSGKVLRSQRLDTTGDSTRDAIVDSSIEKLGIGKPPPPDFPQPVALLISPRQTNDSGICIPYAPDLRRAANL